MRPRPAAATTWRPFWMPTRKPIQVKAHATAAAPGQTIGELTNTTSGTLNAVPSRKPAMPVRVPANSSPGGMRSKRSAALSPVFLSRRPSMPPTT